MRKGTCCSSVLSSFRGGEVGKANGRRLGPSLDFTSSTHPTQSLNPYDPNATPKPSSVLPASGHTSPRLALVPCWSCPSAVCQPRPGREVAGPTGGKSLGRGGAGSAREGSPARGVGFCTASGSVAGAAARMFLEPQVGLWQCGTAGQACTRAVS